MRKLYDQWHAQGISKQAFCKQNGIVYHTFNYWVKKFGKENLIAAAPTRGFSQISIQEPELSEQNQHVLAAITFPSGARMELFGPLDASFVKKLIL